MKRNCKTVAIKINLYKKLKHECIEEDLTLKDMLEKVIIEYFENQESNNTNIGEK